MTKTEGQSNSEREEIKHILNDYVIHGVTAFKCKDNAYMVETLTTRLEQYFADHTERVRREATLNVLGRLIPNYDGVGTIGYQYDDGSRVSLDEIVERIELHQNTNKEEGVNE